MKNLLFGLILLGLSATTNYTLSQSLFGRWDKAVGPGDPIRYDFLPDSTALIYFQTSFDTADYTTFSIPSSDLRGIDFGQNGVIGWRGIYQISPDSLVLTIEGYWHTGLPPVPTPTSFTDPTTYDKVITGIVTNETEIPQSFSLLQNYPNPFNPTTKINYTIPKNCLVTIKVYDFLGNEVATLVDEEKTEGNYKIEFYDSKLASGVYFYRMQAESFVETKKLILIK